MIRLSRFKNKDVYQEPFNSSLFSLMDASVIEGLRITPDELNKIDQEATEKELFLLIEDECTFSQLREKSKLLDKFLNNL